MSPLTKEKVKPMNSSGDDYLQLFNPLIMLWWF